MSQPVRKKPWISSDVKEGLFYIGMIFGVVLAVTAGCAIPVAFAVKIVWPH